jgi:hypothetical protein
MSDGLTDASRDVAKMGWLSKWGERLADFLETPSISSYRSLKRTADIVTSYPRGYWIGKEDVSSGLKQRVRALQNGDEVEWKKLLDIYRGSLIMYDTYSRLKDLREKFVE